jgi:hypothetical protein
MKLGFICEGFTERLFIESNTFQQLLLGLSHICIFPVIDAKGNGNLLPKYLPEQTRILLDKGAERIFIITDLDEDACITVTKTRIAAPNNHIVIVSVRKIEAWFLADSAFMFSMCNSNIEILEPENEPNPFERIRSLLLEHTGRGIPLKSLLAKRAVNNNFSIRNAAAHPSCPSAKYFMDKLEELARI